MRHTMFDTPVIKTIFRWISLLTLKLLGWKVEGGVPADVKKAVLIAAPHTSNWDFMYTLMMAFALRIRIYWMGKQELFPAPFRGLMMWLGGIPVPRHKSNNLVQASAEAIRNAREFLLAVPPEGTRAKVTQWKTGFYYIAQGAGVPILLAYLDYGRKVGGIGPVFMPTGDIQADMKAIRAFYAGIRGKHPQHFHAD